MSTALSRNEYDAIVVGGSYAGLSAATQLARARRRVLVIDAGQRRNRYARHSHGFLTQDGTEGAAIAAQGKEQLLAYPTVTWLNAKAETATATAHGFSVKLADGTCSSGASFSASRLVLATGMIDELPKIEGVAERWGSSIFQCPYCDGYELGEGNIGLLAAGQISMHQATILPDWGRLTLFLNDTFEPDAAELATLSKRGVTIERTAVQRIDGQADVVLRDGRLLPMDGLFITSKVHMASPLATQLGCALKQGPTGMYVQTDMMKASTTAGVYCCGDTASMAPSVAFAVADGAMAGVAAHQSLIFGAVAAQI